MHHRSSVGHNGTVAGYCRLAAFSGNDGEIGERQKFVVGSEWAKMDFPTAAVQLENGNRQEIKIVVLLSSISLQCSSNQLVVAALRWRGGA